MNSTFASSATAISSIETTVGELVELLTNIALDAGHSEQESYLLTCFAIEDLLIEGIENPQLN